MNNSIFKYGLIVLGEILLVTGLYLFLEEQTGEKWFWLDVIVLSFVYLAIVLICPGLFVSAKEFSENVTGQGVAWFFTGLYTLLAVAGIVAGVLLHISFELQCLYQVAFVGLYALGMYWANLASEKFREVRMGMVEEYNRIDRLKEKIALLQVDAVQGMLPEDLKEEIKNLSRRMEYISPNPGSVAMALEDHLSKELSGLSLLVKTTPTPVPDIRQSLQVCENMIKERLKQTVL